MSTTAWIALVATWAVAVASPGPDFVAVLRSGFRFGRGDALAVAAGVVTGIACWIVLALTGLSLVIAAHAGLYAALRIVGAVFLVSYGALILWHNRKSARVGAGVEPTARDQQRSRWAAYRLGLMTNLANPKAVVFFGALLASLLPAETTLSLKLAVMMAMLAIALGWFGFAATMASLSKVSAAYQRARRGIETALGSLFIGLGGLLLRH